MFIGRKYALPTKDNMHALAPLVLNSYFVGVVVKRALRLARYSRKPLLVTKTGDSQSFASRSNDPRRV